MKFLIIFALAFATVLAKDLYSRAIEAPMLENEGRIINGQIATPGKFKYQAGISMKKQIIIKWCSGSLIHKNWILSNGHCTFEALSGKVYLGATEREAGEKVYSIPKGDIFTFPDFNKLTYENDISLIRIPTTSESSKIGIVRIPSNGDKHVGYNVVVSGWGHYSDSSYNLTNDLRYGILKVSPDSLCSQVYKSLYNVRKNICVATPNKVSPCNGDSGDPLVLEKENLQIGLLSRVHPDGCAKGIPVVFTRVGVYLIWINSIIG